MPMKSIIKCSLENVVGVVFFCLVDYGYRGNNKVVQPLSILEDNEEVVSLDKSNCDAEEKENAELSGGCLFKFNSDGDKKKGKDKKEYENVPDHGSLPSVGSKGDNLVPLGNHDISIASEAFNKFGDEAIPEKDNSWETNFKFENKSVTSSIGLLN
ncbi:hypothetical protein WN944_010256 [Citrus x changshan-huyou]|uniref:Uncharacterized protein n=1 Tax=Citrus x changshan-huyou TaxID=2935761 RepID=A0AAP0MXL0_9ROSI